MGLASALAVLALLGGAAWGAYAGNWFGWRGQNLPDPDPQFSEHEYTARDGSFTVKGPVMDEEWPEGRQETDIYPFGSMILGWHGHQGEPWKFSIFPHKRKDKVHSPEDLCKAAGEMQGGRWEVSGPTYFSHGATARKCVMEFTSGGESKRTIAYTVKHDEDLYFLWGVAGDEQQSDRLMQSMLATMEWK